MKARYPSYMKHSRIWKFILLGLLIVILVPFGLFAYGILTKRGVNDRLVPYICVAAPVICFAINQITVSLTGYKFGYELLMLNGMLVFLGMYLTSHRAAKAA